MYRNDVGFADRGFCFDHEAHFYSSGMVNKQNFQYWAIENPQPLHQNSLHSDKVIVWCDTSQTCFIGPYFFS